MHPLEVKGLPNGGHDGLCDAISPFETSLFQSSHPQLKRFIMVDQSGGKGRIFVHPSLAEELFSPRGQIVKPKIEEAERTEDLHRNSSLPSDVDEASTKLQAFRQTVAMAFGSLRALKDIRRVDAATPWAQLLPPAPATSSSSSSRTKRVSGAVSESEEDSKDLDALLSSDDEEEEVTSTAKLSEEQSTDESYWSDGEEQWWKKREEGDKGERWEGRKQEGEGKGRKSSRQEGSTEKGEQEYDVEEREAKRFKQEGSARKLKIKRTVKTLRKMIPGGSCLDAALVLEETILYVKILRDRINQLEATRFPIQS